jgi:hypothetical protein
LILATSAFAVDLETEDTFYQKDPKKQAPAPKPSPSASTTSSAPAITIETSTPEPSPSASSKGSAAAPAVEDDGPVDVVDDQPTPIQGDQKAPQIPQTDSSNFTGEPKYIHHPLAQKGLIEITGDREYIYDVGHTPQTRAASLRFGFYDPTQLQNPDTGVHFTDLYSAQNVPMILLDYEWLLWRVPGRLFFTAGGGFFVANGHGRFVHETFFTPRENFTFLVFPASAGLTWRLQFFEHQIFVPYVTGGATIFSFAEIRDDSVGPRFGGSPAAYAGGGLAINMNFMDTRSMLELDREYGINDVWFTAEFRRFQAIDTRFDFSANFINAGFLISF